MAVQPKFDWAFVGAIMMCFPEKDDPVKNSKEDFDLVIQTITDMDIKFPHNSDERNFGKFQQAVVAIEKYKITYHTLGEVASSIKGITNPKALYAPTEALSLTPMYSGSWDNGTYYSPCTVKGFCNIIFSLINSSSDGQKRSRDRVRNILYDGGIKFPGNSTAIGVIFAGGGGKSDVNAMVNLVVSAPTTVKKPAPNLCKKGDPPHINPPKKQSPRASAKKEPVVLVEDISALHEHHEQQKQSDQSSESSSESDEYEDEISDTSDNEVHQQTDSDRVRVSKCSVKKEKYDTLKAINRKLKKKYTIAKIENRIYKEILEKRDKSYQPMEIMTPTHQQYSSPISFLSPPHPQYQLSKQLEMEQHYHLQNQQRQIKQQQLKEQQLKQQQQQFKEQLHQQQLKDKEDEQKIDDNNSPSPTTTTTTSTSTAMVQSPLKFNDDDFEIDNSQQNNNTLQICEPDGDDEQEEIWKHAFDPLPTSVSKNTEGNSTNLGGINARVFSLAKPIYPDATKLDTSKTFNENLSVINLRSFNVLFSRVDDGIESFLLEVYLSTTCYFHCWLAKGSAPPSWARYLTFSRASRGKVIFKSQDEFIAFIGSKDNRYDFTVPEVNDSLSLSIKELIDKKYK